MVEGEKNLINIHNILPEAILYVNNTRHRFWRNKKHYREKYLKKKANEKPFTIVPIENYSNI